MVIMDGWGLGTPDEYNAIDNAKTPNFDRLIREYANTRVKSDGLAVGLPEGQFGTSEVNHLTIGSGRVIFQDLPKINMAIDSGAFFSNEALNTIINRTKEKNARLHLMGILSDGGVHSHLDHLFALFKLLSDRKFENEIYLHLFTDGRDVAPKSAEKYFKALDEEIKKYKGLKIVISTIQGRSFLDRDRDWNRTETAFKLIKDGEGIKVNSWESAVNFAYNTYSSDEQFPQYLIDENGLLKSNDSLIMFHYRTDRVYQIVKRILDEKFKKFDVLTFISVSEEFKNVLVSFPRDSVTDTLAEIISKAGKTQLHVTETEKYPHLTYFLNGEKEQEFTGEEWALVESNRFIKPYYNYEPSMRNFEIAKKIIAGIEGGNYDFIISNFSSCDMVGHTGNYSAAVISAESVDFCLGKIYESIKDKLDDYALIITADHGNSEVMWDYENNQPHTQHTLSPVPFIVVTNGGIKLARRETLSDIAPTVLDLMDLKKPEVMTGETLILKD